MTTTEQPGFADEVLDGIGADLVRAVREAVSESMPYSSLVLDAIREAVRDAIWNPLPPGSHLRLDGDDHRGVDVVAVRSGYTPSTWTEHIEVLTERGDVMRLDADRRLRIGPK